jgi:hypothetical protein
MHYTPTYSSWLNQIELWFAKIERDIIARGISTSTADLRRKLMQYIRVHNRPASRSSGPTATRNTGSLHHELQLQTTRTAGAGAVATNIQ